VSARVARRCRRGIEYARAGVEPRVAVAGTVFSRAYWRERLITELMLFLMTPGERDDVRTLVWENWDVVGPVPTELLAIERRARRNVRRIYNI
jgi:hypothetical protein